MRHLVTFAAQDFSWGWLENRGGRLSARHFSNSFCLAKKRRQVPCQSSLIPLILASVVSVHPLSNPFGLPLLLFQLWAALFPMAFWWFWSMYTWELGCTPGSWDEYESYICLMNLHELPRQKSNTFQKVPKTFGDAQDKWVWRLKTWGWEVGWTKILQQRSKSQKVSYLFCHNFVASSHSFPLPSFFGCLASRRNFSHLRSTISLAIWKLGAWSVCPNVGPWTQKFLEFLLRSLGAHGLHKAHRPCAMWTFSYSAPVKSPWKKPRSLNIALEKRWLEDYFWEGNFSGAMLNFRWVRFVPWL